MPKPTALALLVVLLLPIAGAAVGWDVDCGDDCCPCTGLASMACAGCACCPGPVSLAQPPRLVLDLGTAPLAPTVAEAPRSTPPHGVFHVPRSA